MGGPGSSRWGDYQRPPTREECIPLDAWAIKRAGGLKMGTQGELQWRLVAGPAIRAAFKAVELEGVEFLKVRGIERWPLRSMVGLWITQDSIGRAGFYCPNACGRKVRKVYLPFNAGHDQRLACRRCHRLTYNSQYEDPFHRAMYKLLFWDDGEERLTRAELAAFTNRPARG